MIGWIKPIRFIGQGGSGSQFVPISATGGTVTDITVDGQSYRLHTFLSSDEFTVSDLGTSDGSVEYFILGSGGGAAHHANESGTAGGGSGAQLLKGSIVLGPGSYPVVVPAGGAAGAGTANGVDGGSASFAGVSALGGTGGATHSTAGRSGFNGSGAGGSSTLGTNPLGGVGSSGRNGGRGWGSGTGGMRAAGGGAGMGTSGTNASSGQGGAGGLGVDDNFFGVSLGFCGGGGGSADINGLGGEATHGGGRGVGLTDGSAGSGLSGTGGGGGGASSSKLSGNGGSGRVGIRYKIGSATGGGGEVPEAVLDIPTHDGNPSVTHPDVFYTEAGWNGSKYWMVYTPWPTDLREVPEIVISDDGQSFDRPVGTPVPLFTNEQFITALGSEYLYNSDPDLVLMENGNLAAYMRPVGGTAGGPYKEWLVRTVSSDGVNWSPIEVCAETLIGDPTSYRSPSLVRDPDGSLQMWTVGQSGGQDFKVFHRSSADGVTWSAPALCTTPGGLGVWHIDVTRIGDTYHMLAHSASTSMVLYYWTSTDKISWVKGLAENASQAVVPISGVDLNQRYRSSLQDAGNGKFHIWMTVVDTTTNPNNTHRIAAVLNHTMGW